ncbi:MAG: hypothetical protein WBG48_05325 [Pricia sp.]
MLDYHLKQNPSKKLENGIRLLISKKIKSQYNAVFYKIESTNEFYLGFADNENTIVDVIKFRKGANVSMFENNLYIIKPKEKNSDVTFTFFVGEVPFDGYSNMELEWNCSEDDSTSVPLVDNKYYFLLKNGLHHNICNIRLVDSEEKSINLTYNVRKGLTK